MFRLFTFDCMDTSEAHRITCQLRPKRNSNLFSHEHNPTLFLQSIFDFYERFCFECNNSNFFFDTAKHRSDHKSTGYHWRPFNFQTSTYIHLSGIYSGLEKTRIFPLSLELNISNKSKNVCDAILRVVVSDSFPVMLLILYLTHSAWFLYVQRLFREQQAINELTNVCIESLFQVFYRIYYSLIPFFIKEKWNKKLIFVLALHVPSKIRYFLSEKWYAKIGRGREHTSLACDAEQFHENKNNEKIAEKCNHMQSITHFIHFFQAFDHRSSRMPLNFYALSLLTHIIEYCLQLIAKWLLLGH